jgi:hypothetical protein
MDFSEKYKYTGLCPIRFFRIAFQFRDPKQKRIAFHIPFHLGLLYRRSDPILFPIRAYTILHCLGLHENELTNKIVLHLAQEQFDPDSLIFCLRPVSKADAEGLRTTFSPPHHCLLNFELFATF